MHPPSKVVTQEPFPTGNSAVVGLLTVSIDMSTDFLSDAAYFDKADQSSGKEVKNVMEV